MTLIIAIHPYYCWWLHQFHMFHSILPPLYRHKIHMFCWWSRPFSPSNPVSLLNLIFHFHPFPIKIIPLIPPSTKATFHGSAPTCIPQRSGCLSATSQTRCPRCQESGAQKRQQGPDRDRDRPTAENHGCTASRGSSWWDLTGLEDCSWDFTA